MPERSGEQFHPFLCSGARAVMMLRRKLEGYGPCALGEGCLSELTGWPVVLTSCQYLL